MTMTSDKLRALADALCVRHYDLATVDVIRAADYLRACADNPAPAVPAGWKLVPVEPTPEMLSAVGMMDGYDCHAPGCSPDADHANWYSAMIAAAPSAPQAEPKREPLSEEQMRAVLIAEARRIAVQAGEKDPDSLTLDEEMLAQVMLAGRAVERARRIGGNDGN